MQHPLLSARDADREPAPAPAAAAAAAAERARHTEQWLQFALRQEARAAPHTAPETLGPAAGNNYGIAAGRGYRLALSHLECLPLFQGADRPFDVRLGATLFDPAASCFFGPTAYSTPVSYDMRRSKGKRGFHVDLSHTLYLHTDADLVGAGSHVSSSGLLAVVEVVLVERGDSGAARAEYSAGWCVIPLGSAAAAAPAQLLGAAGAAGGAAARMGAAARGKRKAGGTGWLAACLGRCSAVQSPTASPGPAHAGLPAAAALGPGSPMCSGSPLVPQLGTGGATLCVPVWVGSPRYLQLRQELPPAQCLLPVPLLADGADCRLHYQFGPCPGMAAWAPLVPPNFLVSSSDVVPGVQRRVGPLRQARSGSGGERPCSGGRQLTRRAAGAVSRLEPALLHDVHAVVLTGLHLRLPDGFAEVARQVAAGQWRQARGGQPGLAVAGGAGDRLLPLRELQQRLCLRVSVHNGRRFVGPPVLCPAAALRPVEGRRGEHDVVLGQDAPLAWLPADRLVAIVLELLLLTAAAPAAAHLGSSCGGSSAEAGPCQRCTGEDSVLGWAAAAPFDWDSSCCGEPAVAEGRHEAALRSGPGRWLRPTPVLDWRRLLERTNRVSPEAPKVAFTLRLAPGQAVWPPPAAPMPLRLPQLPATSHGLRENAAPPPAEAALQLAVAAAPARPEQAAEALVAEAASTRHQQERQQAGRPGVSAAPTEAETLVSVRAQPQCKPGTHLGGLGRLAGSTKGLPRGSTSGAAEAAPGQAGQQVWQIQAAYGGAGPPQEQPPGPPARGLSSIRTAAQRVQAPMPPSGDEAAALYAGSPSAKQARGTGSWASLSAADAAVAAAAFALAAADPQPAAACQVSSTDLAAELADPLVSIEASLQVLAFEAQPTCRICCNSGDAAADGGQLMPPRRLHLTFRFFTADPPTVTAPFHLEPVPGADSCRGQLYSLSAHALPSGSNDCDGGFSAGAGAAPQPPPALRLQLLDVAALEQQLQSLAGQGLPECAAASLVRQHRLRGAQYLAGRQLQVDLWDSDSRLQAGSLSVPLLCLLRRGKPAAGALLRLPVLDPAAAVARLEGGGQQSTRLCSEPLRGDMVVKLACAGHQLPLLGSPGSASIPPGAGHGSSISSLTPMGVPPSLCKQRGREAVVVRRQLAPALEDAGQLAQELARQEGGPLAVVAACLREGIQLQAADTVQRALHARVGSAPTVAGTPGGGSTTAATVVAAAAVQQEQAEVAREHCKRHAILRRLQAELPSCVVLCAGPGDVVGFEREFANSSSEAAHFELAFDGDSGSSWGTGGTCAGCSHSLAAGNGGTSSTDDALELIADAHEWEVLRPAAELAGLAAGQPVVGSPGAHSRGASHSRGSCLRVISSPSFQLGPHERCVLRLKLCRCLNCQLQAAAAPVWHEVSIRRCSPWSPSRQAASLADVTGAPVAMVFKVAVLPLAPAPVLDRTLRLYCPAAGIAPHATTAHAVQLAQLPAADRLLAAVHQAPGAAGSAPTFMPSCPDLAAELQLQRGRVILSCGVAPQAGTTQRYLLALHAGRASSSLSSPSRSSGGNSAGTSRWPLLEVWEVFVHGLPAIHLAASVGGTAAASWPLPASLASLASQAASLRCNWQECSGRELQAEASVPSLPIHPGSGARLALRYKPAVISRRELLLSVAAAATSGPRLQQAAELLLVCLNSTRTPISRTFEVQVPRGQAVSKKVRYRSPHLQPRHFVVRSLQPGLLRVSTPTAAADSGINLAGGGAASFKLTFDASGLCECGSGGSGTCSTVSQEGQQGQARLRQQQGRHELLAVIESAPLADSGSGAASGSPTPGSGDSGSGSQAGRIIVEEVFRVLLHVI